MGTQHGTTWAGTQHVGTPHGPTWVGIHVSTPHGPTWAGIQRVGIQHGTTCGDTTCGDTAWSKHGRVYNVWVHNMVHRWVYNMWVHHMVQHGQVYNMWVHNMAQALWRRARLLKFKYQMFKEDVMPIFHRLFPPNPHNPAVHS